MRYFKVLGLVWALVFSCGCSTSEAPTPEGPCGHVDALAALSDYSSSLVGSLSLDGGAQFTKGVDLGADPALTESRDRAFFLARDTGSIFELNACGEAVKRYSANDPNHPGTSDPYDVAVAPDGSLWIARFYIPSVLILAPGDGGTRTVDLSSFDSDGNPNMSSIRILDGIGSPPASKAFVTLGVLDDAHMLLPKGPSLMVRIDVATAAVDGHVTLAGQNPFALMVEANGALWLADPGSFSAINEPNAGIERFDPQAFTSKLFVTEHDLGGSVVEVAVSPTCGAAIVADPTPANATTLVTFDPATGAVLVPSAKSILATPGYYLQALLWVSDDVLLVGDGTPAMAGGVVHVFDRSGACDLHERSATLKVPLKPIAFVSAP